MQRTNELVFVCRHMRRKVERYRAKHPELSFTQAYNKIYGTKYDEPTKRLDMSMNDNVNKTANAEVENNVRH